jgi:hypothetical protein
MMLLGRDWILEFGDPSLAHTLAASDRFLQSSRDGYTRFVQEHFSAGNLREGITVDAIVEWILFVRVAIWSDDASSREDLGRMLERFFIPAFLQ